MTTETTTETLEAVVSDVPSQPDEQALAPIPTTELEKISATDKHLADLLEEGQRIAALGVPQTLEQYKVVHDFTMVAVKVRTGSEKLAKTIAAPHKAKYDAIIAEGKRIGEKALEAENLTAPLKAVWDDADKERKRLIAEQRAADERAKAARTLERAQALHAIGAISQPGVYLYGEIRIEAVELTDLPETEWVDLFGRVEAAAAEQKRKDEAFAEQLRLELEAEKKQKEAELKRQQDEADALRKQQDELLDGRLALRIDKLVGMGWQDKPEQKEIDAGDYGFFPYPILRNWSNAEFDEAIGLYETWHKERTETSERIQSRWAQLIELGWAEYESGRIRFEGFNPAVTADLLGRLSDEKFVLLKQNFKQWQIDEANEVKAQALREANAAKQAAAADKAKQKADKERAKRLAPDKKRLGKWLKAFDFSLPEMNEGEAIDLMAEFVSDVEGLVRRYIDKIDAL